MNCKYALRFLAMMGVAFLGGCAGTNGDGVGDAYETPGVDYVEQLDVYSAPHKDSFLNQLAMNYRSYAVYNARTSGYPDIGELFAQKAIGAFSGETPFPESLDNWNIKSENERFEIHNAYNELMDMLKGDALQLQPKLAAEGQAKFDCWVSAAASGQDATAQECRGRFIATMQALHDCIEGRGGKTMNQNPNASVVAASLTQTSERYYPETHSLSAMSGSTRAREGLVIVNNVNIPSNLVQVVPVPAGQPAQAQTQPLIFNQNIYGVDSGSGTYTEERKSGTQVVQYDEQYEDLDSKYVSREEFMNAMNKPSEPKELVVNVEAPDMDGDYVSREEFMNAMNKPSEPKELVVNVNHEMPEVSGDYVSREEFIDMMLAMRAELAAINERLNSLNNKAPVANNEKTVIKVQQIPLEPKQHVMEEIFEIRFDFDKSTIKPEYEELIRRLASTTQANKNIKVSVVGHTDTAGSSSYNYALGGRRAEAVQRMLIQYGIPSNQIIAVSAGKEDLKVPTPDNTPNAENRRVRVVKEVHYTEPPKDVAPIVVEQYNEPDDLEQYDESDSCEDCGDM